MSDNTSIYSLKQVQQWQLVKRNVSLEEIIKWNMFTGAGVSSPEYGNRKYWDDRWNKITNIQPNDHPVNHYIGTVLPELFEACKLRVIKCGLATSVEGSEALTFDNFKWNMEAIDKLSNDRADAQRDVEGDAKERFCVCFYSAVMTYLYPNLLGNGNESKHGLFDDLYVKPVNLSAWKKNYEDFQDCLKIDKLDAHKHTYIRLQGFISMRLTLTIIDKYFEWKAKNDAEMKNLEVAVGVVGKINELKNGLTPAQQALVDKLLTAAQEKSSSSSTPTVRSPTAIEKHHQKIQKAVDIVNKAVEQRATTTTTLTPQENGSSSSLTEGQPPLPAIPKDAVMPESGFKIGEEVWLSHVGQNQLRSNDDARGKNFTRYTRSKFKVTEILEKGDERMYKTYVVKHNRFSYEVTGTALRKLQFIGSEYHDEDVNKADYYTLEEYLYESMHETVYDENAEYKQKFYYEALINEALKANKDKETTFVDLTYALASYKKWDLTLKSTEDNEKLSKFGIYDAYELVKYKKDDDKRDWVVYDSENGLYSILCVEDGTCVHSVTTDEIVSKRKKTVSRKRNAATKGKTAAVLKKAREAVKKRKTPSKSKVPNSSSGRSKRIRRQVRKLAPGESGVEQTEIADEEGSSSSSDDSENSNAGAGSAKSPINVEDESDDGDF